MAAHDTLAFPAMGVLLQAFYWDCPREAGVGVRVPRAARDSPRARERGQRRRGEGEAGASFSFPPSPACDACGRGRGEGPRAALAAGRWVSSPISSWGDSQLVQAGSRELHRPIQMARRWKQVELPMPRTWGGERRGAPGVRRSLAGGRRSPIVDARRHVSRFPVHVTLRAIAGLGTLRVRACSKRSEKRCGPPRTRTFASSTSRSRAITFTSSWRPTTAMRCRWACAAWSSALPGR